MTSAAETVQLARVYLDARNFDRAADVLRNALQTDPHSADLLTELSRTQLRMDNPAAAAHSAYAALAVEPEHVYAMRMYSLALDGVGRGADAMAMAYRAVITAPQDYLTHHGYASLLHNAGRFAEALQVVGEALRLQPNDSDLHFLRGRILHRMNRLKESTEAYQEVLRLDPDNAAAMHNIALNRLRRGRWHVALRGFLGAGRMDPHLGELVRSNVGAALTRPMRWSTLLVFIVCCSVPFAIERTDTELGARIVAGLGSVALAALIVWVARLVPRSAWKSVLKSKPVLGLRLMLAAGAVVVGLTVAAGLGVLFPRLVVLTAFMLMALIALVVVGRILRS